MVRQKWILRQNIKPRARERHSTDTAKIKISLGLLNGARRISPALEYRLFSMKMAFNTALEIDSGTRSPNHATLGMEEKEILDLLEKLLIDSAQSILSASGMEITKEQARNLVGKIGARITFSTSIDQPQLDKLIMRKP